ncbi:MAG: epoxyqueuosine reductase [Oscillospiraceae bacterium]|nr:epoxyqueuosine reductase [Clostridia bacterium]MBP3699588.1 epoxyqueuosine reductase [Oscillospiraceae bacterium]
MKAHTMLETIRSLLGLPAYAIPLSVCKPAKTYLLDRAGIPDSGTAVLFTIPYVMTADVSDPERNISLYAVPRDYHGYMNELGNTLLPFLRKDYPNHAFALFADHSPILESDAAARAGLGVIGLNGLLLTPEYGSFVFIGEIVTDAAYKEVTGTDNPGFPENPATCEGCCSCLKACPSGCKESDRTNCLSALTQKKGVLNKQETNAILKGSLVWGCDTCQLACPHNRAVIQSKKDTPIPYFRENRLIRIDTNTVTSMTDTAFSERAFAWRGRAVIKRNTELFEEVNPKKQERSML